MTTSGKINLDQQRTVFSALNSFTRGREDIFRDKKVVDAPRGFANTEAVAAYLYARQDSIIPKIIGKNSWKDLPYNLNTILQTSDYISRFVNHDASIFQVLGIGVSALAKMSSEERRQLSKNLHYTVLSSLDFQARNIADIVAQSPEEKIEAYSQLRQEFFQGYTKMMEMYAQHPGAEWDDVKRMALNYGVSRNIIDTFEKVRNDQGLIQAVEKTKDILYEAGTIITNSLFMNPETRKTFLNMYKGYPDVKGAEEVAKQTFIRGGIRGETKN